MMREWGFNERELLAPSERVAVDILRASLQFDALAQPLFWETVVARNLGGGVTSHQATHDVEVVIWGRACHAEVKFSSAFTCNYRPIRGKDWTRPVFKWAKPRGGSGKASADAIILIGRDVDKLLYSWIVPRDAIGAKCASITVTTPSHRAPNSISPWDRYATPWDAMLPAFARICHNRYDAPMRRAGIIARARAQLAIADLFEPVAKSSLDGTGRPGA